MLHQCMALIKHIHFFSPVKWPVSVQWASRSTLTPSPQILYKTGLNTLMVFYNTNQRELVMQVIFLKWALKSYLHCCFMKENNQKYFQYRICIFLKITTHFTLLFTLLWPVLPKNHPKHISPTQRFTGSHVSSLQNLNVELFVLKKRKSWEEISHMCSWHTDVIPE